MSITCSHSLLPLTTHHFVTSIYSERQALPLNMMLIGSAGLTGQEALGILLPLPPERVGLQAHTTVPGFLHKCHNFEHGSSCFNSKPLSQKPDKVGDILILQVSRLRLRKIMSSFKMIHS